MRNVFFTTIFLVIQFKIHYDIEEKLSPGGILANHGQEDVNKWKVCHIDDRFK